MTGVVKPILVYLLLLLAVIGLIHYSAVFWNRQSFRQRGTAAVSAEPKIRSVSRDFVYDLSGSEASGLGDAMNLFDENCDPKNDPGSHPVTSPLPTVGPGKFFAKGKGLRIVIDLQGIYSLREIYWYDKAPEADSIWFYTGDMQHWKQAVAYRTAGGPAGWGWKNFPLQAGSRYVMIRFNSPKSVLTELVLYGHLQQKIPAARQSTIIGHRSSQPALNEFAGTNSYDFPPPYLLAPFHHTRVYQLLKWYDNDTAHPYPGNLLTMPWELRGFADSIRKLGNRCWLSIHGLPEWMDRKGMHEKDKPVTQVGMDAEDPMSYGRHAKTFWTLAALFGNTPVNKARINMAGGAPFSGAGLMDRYENGNEEDGWWTDYYWTPMDYFALSSADYDGHERRLGTERGIKQADAGSRLLMSGLVQLDTNRVRTLKFLCEQLRADHRFVWEAGVQYHYYCSDSKSIAQMATRGISPEEDHLREKLARVRAFHNRVLPGVPLILGENGYDRMQGSRQSTPLLPGYDAGQSQGIMVLRSLMAAFMSGFDGYNQYMLRDAGNDEFSTGAYATSGMIGGPQNNKVFTAWHYWASAMRVLGNYRPDSILSESGPAWVYRLRHKDHPDSLAYYVVSPTTNGTVVKNYRLTDKNFDNQPIEKINLMDGAGINGTKTGKAGKGFVELDVTESPGIVLIKR